MASKMTPEQKALNKEAMKLRNAAYSSRRKLYQAEMDEARALIENGELGRATDAANKASQAAIDARNADVSAINEKIRLLQDELAKVTSEHQAIIGRAGEARALAYTKRNKALAEAEQAINAKYPDMDGCYNAAAWKSIDEFVPLVKKGN
jgi:hypothetical protein